MDMTSLWGRLAKLQSFFQDGLNVDENSHLPEADLRKISLGNLYVYQQQGVLNTFETGVTPSVRKVILGEYFGITDRDSAIETLNWLSQKRMADLFGVDRATIAYHLSQIYESGEGNSFFEKLNGDFSPVIWKSIEIGDKNLKIVSYIENMEHYNNYLKQINRNMIIQIILFLLKCLYIKDTSVDEIFFSKILLFPDSLY
jgi:hypothetical protein